MQSTWSRLSRLWALAMVAVLPVGFEVTSGLAQGVSGGFQRQQIAKIPRPTALAFTPAGDLYAASQEGRLYFVDGGTGTPNVVLDITAEVCDVAGEQGLLGVAVDPGFSDDAGGFVYLYYSAAVGGECKEVVNRAVRYRVEETGDFGEEQILVDNIPTPAPKGNHNGGDLQFGLDGNLYISVGDGGCSIASVKACQYENPNAQRRNVLLGKILRITPDGEIPNGNPYEGSGAPCRVTGTTQDPNTWCEEIWATGFRNPFRIAFDPDDKDAAQTLYINDVGGSFWEEIDRGQAGANYGWNRCEGRMRAGSATRRCRNEQFVNPIFAYRHSETARPSRHSITGGAFVPDDATWPPKFEDGYLFADLGGGIYLLKQDQTADLTNPVIRAIAPIHLVFHEGALYYSDIGAGAIFRVQSTR